MVFLLNQTGGGWVLCSWWGESLGSHTSGHGNQGKLIQVEHHLRCWEKHSSDFLNSVSAGDRYQPVFQQTGTSDQNVVENNWALAALPKDKQGICTPRLRPLGSLPAPQQSSISWTSGLSQAYFLHTPGFGMSSPLTVKAKVLRQIQGLKVQRLPLPRPS